MKTITYPTREAWLADRPNYFGASESAGVLGYGFKGQSAMSVYAGKVEPTLDEVIDATMAEQLEIGLEQEPTIGRMFTKRSGWKVDHNNPEQPTICISDERPYLSTTLDGWVFDGVREVPWEAKNVGEYVASDWDNDSVPMRVQIQTQHQMYVTGRQWAYVAALLGGNRFVWQKVERNQRFIDNLLLVLDDFWAHVQRKEPPPVDGTEATSAALKRLYGRDSGETVMLPETIVLPGKTKPLNLDQRRQSLKAGIKKLEGDLEYIDNTIKAAMGNATYGQVPGQKARYRWQTNTQQRKATEAKTISTKTFLRLKQ